MEITFFSYFCVTRTTIDQRFMVRFYVFLLTGILCCCSGHFLSAQEHRNDTITEVSQKDEAPKIKWSGNRLIVENLPKEGLLEIFNIMGAKVFTRRVKAGYNEYLLNLPKGMYIIRIGSFTKKIIIE